MYHNSRSRSSCAVHSATRFLTKVRIVCHSSAVTDSCVLQVQVQVCAPISEILDTRTRSLLRVVDCKGYVMSNQIVSAVISQV